MPVPGKTTIEPLFRITVRASGGLWVRLEPRNNNNAVDFNVDKKIFNGNLISNGAQKPILVN